MTIQYMWELNKNVYIKSISFSVIYTKEQPSSGDTGIRGFVHLLQLMPDSNLPPKFWSFASCEKHQC